MLIILFDGECNLCNKAVAFIIKRNSKETIFFAHKNGAVAAAIKTKFGLPHTITEKTIVFLNGEKYYTKSRAVLEIVKNLDSLWPLLYLCILIPHPLRDYVYDFVSRRRLIFSSEKTACPIISDGSDSRFL